MGCIGGGMSCHMIDFCRFEQYPMLHIVTLLHFPAIVVVEERA
jgi:hypothetical protein